MEIGGEGGEYTVLFDGKCPMCRAAVGRLRRWDRKGVLSYLPAESAEVGIRFPWVSPQALGESIHLVGPGGKTWEGAAALEELVRLLPGWRWTGWAFGLPLARPLARRAYRWIARNRYRFRCEDHCGSGEG